MDRFIVVHNIFMTAWSVSLKSNMDRFIEYSHNKDREKNTSLKSNMDRFIVRNKKTYARLKKSFKIQYG